LEWEDRKLRGDKLWSCVLDLFFSDYADFRREEENFEEQYHQLVLIILSVSVLKKNGIVLRSEKMKKFGHDWRDHILSFDMIRSSRFFVFLSKFFERHSEFL
jgi:hypothetical protein